MDSYNEDFWKALDELVNSSKIVIDRPRGSAHPRFPNFIYKVDYGYLKNTASMDGAGIDVWVGSGDKKVDAIMCIVGLMKRDSEIKILIGCTEEEKLPQIRLQTLPRKENRGRHQTMFPRFYTHVCTWDLENGTKMPIKPIRRPSLC